MKNIKKNLTELLGFEPSRNMIVKILQEVKSSGKCLEEVAGIYGMPKIFILDSKSSPIKYNGEEMTVEEFRKRYPYKRIVRITPRENQ